MTWVSRVAAVHGAFWVADRYRGWWYVWPASLALLIAGWIYIDKPNSGVAQESALQGDWVKPTTTTTLIPMRNSPILANWPEKLHDDVKACFSNPGDIIPPINACTRLIDSGEIANQQRASAYNQRGFLQRRNQPARALEDFEAALRIVPNMPPAPTNRAFIYLTRNQTDAALADLNKAIDQFPPAASAGAHFLRGAAYKQRLEYDKAIADLDEAQRIEPNVPDHLVIRGEIEEAGKNYDAALVHFDEFSKRAPRDPRGLIGRATVLDSTGHPQEALAALDSALSLALDNMRAAALRDRLRARQAVVDPPKKADDPPK
jgi:tetratricopeptide (TPR) repeat protein